MSGIEHPPKAARRVGALAIGALALVRSAVCFAGDDAAKAQALFDGAVAAMEAGHFEEACPKLAESDRLEASGGTALNLGYCYEHLSKWGRAYEAYLLADAHYAAAHKPDRVKVAQDHADAIRAHVSFVHVVGMRDVGSILRVDGEERTLAAGLLVVDRGQHTLTVVVAARERSIPFPADADETNVTIPDDVVVTPAVGPLALSPPPPWVAPPPPPPPNTKRTVAFVVGGSALALGVAAAITGAFALEREGASNAACPDGRCTAQGVTAHDTAQVFAVTTDVLLGTAIIGLGVATVLFFMSKTPPKITGAMPFGFRF